MDIHQREYLKVYFTAEEFESYVRAKLDDEHKDSDVFLSNVVWLKSLDRSVEFELLVIPKSQNGSGEHIRRQRLSTL